MPKSGMFDDKRIPIPCPKCGQKTEQSVAWIKAHDHFACPGCGTRIDIQADNFLDGIRTAETALDDFKKTLANSFGKIGKRR